VAKKKPERWIAVFAKFGNAVPARSWLNGCPKSVQVHLAAVVTAVRDGPPPSFPDSNYWHAMHGEMKGFFECRDQYDKWNYRLLCILDRDAPNCGLEAPALVMLTGGRKQEGHAELPAAVFDEARALRTQYLKRTPRSVATS